MELLKEIGSEAVTFKNGKVKKFRFGIFICPNCGAEIKHRMHTGKKRKSCGAVGCKAATSDKYGKNRVYTSIIKTHKYYQQINAFYNRNIKHLSLSPWKSFETFMQDMYESYEALKDKGVRNVTLYVYDNNPLSVSNCAWVSATSLSYTSFDKDIANGVFHTRRLAIELDTAHDSVVKSLNRISSKPCVKTVGTVSEYGFISKPIDTVVLDENLYGRLRDIILNHRKSKDSANTVYLVKCSNLVKIGITNNIVNRLTTLTGASALPIELLHTATTMEAGSIEKHLHEKYAEFNKHHEWFELTEEQIKEITEYLDSVK